MRSRRRRGAPVGGRQGGDEKRWARGVGGCGRCISGSMMCPWRRVWWLCWLCLTRQNWCEAQQISPSQTQSTPYSWPWQCSPPRYQQGSMHTHTHTEQIKHGITLHLLLLQRQCWWTSYIQTSMYTLTHYIIHLQPFTLNQASVKDRKLSQYRRVASTDISVVLKVSFSQTQMC